MTFIHFSHGGGTFMCGLATDNCEAYGGGVRGAACHLPGDVPFPKPAMPRQCSARQRLVAQGGGTFAAIERGLESFEFCTDSSDFVTVLRDPMQRMDSIASYYSKTRRQGLKREPTQAELRKEAVGSRR